jgi:hypothetical protein
MNNMTEQSKVDRRDSFACIVTVLIKTSVQATQHSQVALEKFFQQLQVRLESSRKLAPGIRS